MASQVHIGSYQESLRTEASAERHSTPVAVKKPQFAASNAQPVVAHSIEFVALPGRAQSIQSEIPTAMNHAFSGIEGFVGCLVLISDQEARLVTIITLWGGENRGELCGDSSKRLQKWLAPYVDRWLRTRQYASFVTAPQRFPVNPEFQEEVTVIASHLQ